MAGRRHKNRGNRGRNAQHAQESRTVEVMIQVGAELSAEARGGQGGQANAQAKAQAGGQANAQAGGQANAQAGGQANVEVGVAAVGGGAALAAELSVNLGLTDEQFSAIWERISAEATAGIPAVEFETMAVQAGRWEKLEHWLLKEHGAQVHQLWLHMAKLDMLMQTYDATLEANIQLAGQAFMDHIDARIAALVESKMSTKVDAAINLRFNDERDAIIDEIDIDIDVNALVRGEFDKHCDRIERDVTKAVSDDVDVMVRGEIQRLKAKWASKVTLKALAELQNKLNADIKVQLAADWDAAIKARLDAAVIGITRNLVLYEGQLGFEIAEGDRQLFRWAKGELLRLRRCITDRQTFVEAFAQFSSALGRQLDGADCVQFDRWEGIYEPTLGD